MPAKVPPEATAVEVAQRLVSRARRYLKWHELKATRPYPAEHFIEAEAEMITKACVAWLERHPRREP